MVLHHLPDDLVCFFPFKIKIIVKLAVRRQLQSLVTPKLAVHMI